MKRSREVVGLSFIGIGLFLVLSFYLPSLRSGFLGHFLLRISKGLIGQLAYVLPVLFLALGLNSLLQRKKRFTSVRAFHLVLSLIIVSALFQLLSISTESFKKGLAAYSSASITHLEASEFIRFLWDASFDASSFSYVKDSFLAGVIGGSLAEALAHILGRLGSILLLILSLLAQGIIIFNLSYTKILYKTGEKLSLWVEKSRILKILLMLDLTLIMMKINTLKIRGLLMPLSLGMRGRK